MLNVHDYHSNPEKLDQTPELYFQQRKAFIEKIITAIQSIEDEADTTGEIEGETIYVYATRTNTRHNPGDMMITISDTPNFLPIIELDENDKPKHMYHNIKELTDEILGRYAPYDDDD